MSQNKKDFARQLRGNPCQVYDALWQQLRKNQLGVRFRRRSILLGWIPDFWCPAARVAIEIEYDSDRERTAEHRRRDAILFRNAILVIRIPAQRVSESPEQVAREVGLVVEDSIRRQPYNNSLQRDREG